MKTIASRPARTLPDVMAPRLRRDNGAGKRRLLALTGVCAAIAAAPVQAIDFGPFTLTGFAKTEATLVTNQCRDCQLHPDEDKQRFWADELVPGKPYQTTGNSVVLMQPYLGAEFDLGRGFRLNGLLSQRWRDGRQDIDGFWYERNIAISHEDYGSVRLGDMTTRSWSIADYPYGTNVNVADVWGASGAGYGILKNALRYTSRLLDVAEGDLVLEVTHSQGNTDFKLHKPHFWEIYAQYRRGDLVVDAMLQHTKNGRPTAWGHGPFWQPSDSVADDSLIGGSGQGIGMVMGRYQLSSKIEISGGLRRNQWSGAHAVITQPESFNYLGQQVQEGLWSPMFNVDWGGSIGGLQNPGYSANSIDYMLGVRYRMGKWTPAAGLVHLGKASTDNPSERGQSNSATVTTVGVNYDYGDGIQLYAFAGLVHYDRLGLAPMSMPGNSSFTNVDSRVVRNGAWMGLGAVYVF